MLFVLQAKKAENVMVVVARWYGMLRWRKVRVKSERKGEMLDAITHN